MTSAQSTIDNSLRQGQMSRARCHQQRKLRDEGNHHRPRGRSPGASITHAPHGRIDRLHTGSRRSDRKLGLDCRGSRSPPGLRSEGLLRACQGRAAVPSDQPGRYGRKPRRAGVDGPRGIAASYELAVDGGPSVIARFCDGTVSIDLSEDGPSTAAFRVIRCRGFWPCTAESVGRSSCARAGYK